MVKTNSMSWAFRFASWKPAQAEWETALGSIQVEEMTRLQKYSFKKDAKSTLAGRLMLRRAIHKQLDIPWADITMARTESGKPYLANQINGAESFNVNVSHSGDYTVLAASDKYQVGVDVMKTEWPKGDAGVDTLFSLFTEQFTQHEWRRIYRYDDEWDQLQAFHRLWSLKESYVKAVGCGLSIDLQRLEFRIYSDLKYGKCTVDTRLYVDGQLLENWCFQETMLDATHSVATALCTLDNTPIKPAEIESMKFDKLTTEQLLDSARTLGHPLPEESFNKFNELKETPMKQ